MWNKLFYSTNFGRILRDDKHPSNILLMSLTLLTFHLDISGNEFNDIHTTHVFIITCTKVRKINIYYFANIFNNK